MIAKPKGLHAIYACFKTLNGLLKVITEAMNHTGLYSWVNTVDHPSVIAGLETASLLIALLTDFWYYVYIVYI